MIIAKYYKKFNLLRNNSLGQKYYYIIINDYFKIFQKFDNYEILKLN